MKKWILLALCIISATASANDADCKKIRDSAKRLACFDQRELNSTTADKDEKFLDAANKVLRALKRMGSRTSAGISYRDYSPALADVIYEIDEFQSSAYATANVQFADAILEAKRDYEMAGTVWSFKFQECLGCSRGFVSYEVGKALQERYRQHYPSLDQFKTDFGYFVDGVIPIIFSAASDQTERASTILKNK